MEGSEESEGLDLRTLIEEYWCISRLAYEKPVSPEILSFAALECLSRGGGLRLEEEEEEEEEDDIRKTTPNARRESQQSRKSIISSLKDAPILHEMSTVKRMQANRDQTTQIHHVLS